MTAASPFTASGLFARELSGRTSASPPAEPVAAATLIVLRDAAALEVLLVRRTSSGAFGGMWVFPGGQVETADQAGDPGELVVARRAAAREASEEAGLEVDPDDLVPYSFWMPPEQAARRFATWFLVTAVPTGVEVATDRSEVHEHQWLTPTAALDEHAVGRLALAPPTWVTLRSLRPYRRAAEVVGAAREQAPARFDTRLVAAPEGIGLVWPGDAAWDTGDLQRDGGRRRLRITEDGVWMAEGLEGGAT